MKRLKYILCSLALVCAIVPATAQKQRLNIYQDLGGNLMDKCIHAIAVADIDSITIEIIPDSLSPSLLAPSNYFYTSTNDGRSIVLEYNEPVFRGEGAITYTVTVEDGVTTYANGTIDNVVINDREATITLPESVVFDENQASSFIFLELAYGAFVDKRGNPTQEINNDLGGQVPWWTSSGQHPLEASGIAGRYNASGPSLFAGEEDIVYNWTCEITPDPNNINGVCICPIFPETYGTVNPIYGIVSDDKKSIVIEAEQDLGTYGNSYNLKLDFNGPTSATAVCEGATITINSLVGAAAYNYNGKKEGYLFAVGPVTLTKIEE